MRGIVSILESDEVMRWERRTQLRLVVNGRLPRKKRHREIGGIVMKLISCGSILRNKWKQDDLKRGVDG